MERQTDLARRNTGTMRQAAALPPDLFVGGTQQGLAYLGRHRRVAWAACALVVLLALGIGSVVTRRASTARAASAAFARALLLLDRPTDEDRAQLAEARRTRDAQLAEADVADAPAALGAQNGEGSPGDDTDTDLPADEGEEPSGEAGAGSPAEAAARAQRASAARRAAQRRAELQAEAAEEREAQRQNVPRFATRKARDAAGQAALLEVWRRWPNQAVAALAALQGANVAARAGDVATADATIAALYGRLEPSAPTWPLVAARHAQALRRAGDLDGAALALQRVARSEHRLLADEAALERAYLLEERGEREAAMAELEDLALKFPDSLLQDEVRAELSALQTADPGSAGAAPSGSGAGSPARAEGRGPVPPAAAGTAPATP